jgi:hypothetical protein
MFPLVDGDVYFRLIESFPVSVRRMAAASFSPINQKIASRH